MVGHGQRVIQIVCKMFIIVHFRGLWVQNWVKFGPRSCRMPPSIEQKVHIENRHLIFFSLSVRIKENNCERLNIVLVINSKFIYHN